MSTIKTAQTISKDLVLDCDVCVIGSGAGGGMLAAGLVERGLNVIMLEAGPYKNRSDFRMNEAEAFAHLYQGRGLQATKDMSVSLMQGSNVGGGTTINWTSCFRTPEEILEHWQTHFGLSNLTSSSMASHFDAVERRLNVSEGLDLANANNQVVIRGARAELGSLAPPSERLGLRK